MDGVLLDLVGRQRVLWRLVAASSLCGFCSMAQVRPTRRAGTASSRWQMTWRHKKSTDKLFSAWALVITAKAWIPRKLYVLVFLMKRSRRSWTPSTTRTWSALRFCATSLYVSVVELCWTLQTMLICFTWLRQAKSRNIATEKIPLSKRGTSQRLEIKEIEISSVERALATVVDQYMFVDQSVRPLKVCQFLL